MQTFSGMFACQCFITVCPHHCCCQMSCSTNPYTRDPCWCCQQVSTYKIVTVNATRQLSDMGNPGQPNSRATTVQPRLTSHPEDSATVEPAVADDEHHQKHGKDEMQTWMLLEASPACVLPCALNCMCVCFHKKEQVACLSASQQAHMFADTVHLFCLACCAQSCIC